MLPRESATFRRDHPDEHHWGLAEQLLAALVEAAQGGNWQRGGNPRAPRPRRIPRPGVSSAAPDGGKQFGKPTGMNRDEMREFLRRWGAGELEGQYEESTIDL